MARPGIGFSDVLQAAQAIKARGEEPTIDRVRDALGTGSKSTIAPHLKRWKSEYQQHTAWETIPDELALAAKTVFEKSQRLAQEKIDSLRVEYDITIQNISQQLNALENDCTQKTQQLTVLAGTLRQQQAECGSLSDDNQRLKNEVATLQQQHCANQATVEQLTTSVHTHQAEKQQLLRQFDHYQAALAAERTAERRSFEIANHTFAVTNQKLESLLASVREEAEALRREAALMKADYQRLCGENATLTASLLDAEQQATLLLTNNQVITQLNHQLIAEKRALSHSVLELTATLSAAKTLEQQTGRVLRQMKIQMER